MINLNKEKYEYTLLTGINQGYVNMEDSISHTSIMGKFDKDSSLKFAQDLANAMDINIIVNRIETWYAKDESVIHLIYDIKSDYNDNNLPVPENGTLNEKYGLKVSPQLSKKLKM